MIHILNDAELAQVKRKAVEAYVDMANHAHLRDIIVSNLFRMQVADIKERQTIVIGKLKGCRQ